MGIICWGTCVPPPTHPPLFAVRGTDYLMSPTLFGIEKKSHISIFICVLLDSSGPRSHSLPIFRYSEHVQYTEDERKQKSEPQ